MRAKSSVLIRPVRVVADIVPNDQRGIALVLAMFLTAALSVLAASLMFLSQTETYASMNYRMMSQARYGAEAAVQKAANFLLDTAQYNAPGTPQAAAGDVLSNYTREVSPVVCATGATGCTAGQEIRLSSTPGIASTYPASAVATAFDTAAKGTLSAGNTQITYTAVARLVAMQQYQAYGTASDVVQIWEVTGKGTLAGSRNASVEVIALVETPKVPASTYGAFATDPSCGALTFGGDVDVNSYDSTSVSGTTTPSTQDYGGNVGTNGNLNISGHVDVDGNLYTPRTGVGSCASGAVTALTETGGADVNGSIVPLPSTQIYPTPPIPTQSMLPAANISALSVATAGATCTSLGLVLGTSTTTPPGNCQVDAANNKIEINGYGSTLTLPTVNLSGGIKLTMVGTSPAAQYNINSISLAGGASVNVKVTNTAQSTILNVVGKNPDGSAIATPLDFSGGAVASPDISAASCSNCSRYDASLFQILYGGTGTINLTGNSQSAVTVYAPNATANLLGTADLYGSLLAKRVSDTSGADIHYDRRLLHDLWVRGNPMASSFTWKRY